MRKIVISLICFITVSLGIVHSVHAEDYFTDKIRELCDKLISDKITPQKKLTIDSVITVPDIDLKSVYRRLDNAGFNPGDYNEENPEQLSEAVKRFQNFAKLNPDGILNPETWIKMEKLYDPEKIRQNPESPKIPPLSNSPSKLPAAPSGSVRVRKVVLLKFVHEINLKNFERNVFDSLSSHFIRKGFLVGERLKMEKCLQDHNISDAQLQEISAVRKTGKDLGGEVVVTGNISESGGSIVVRAQIIDVVKGTEINAAEIEIQKTDEVAAMVQPISVPPAAPVQTVLPPQKNALFYEDGCLKMEVLSFTREPEGIVLKLKYISKLKAPFSLHIRNEKENSYLINELGHQYEFLSSDLTRSYDFPPNVPRVFPIIFQDLKDDGKNFIYSAEYCIGSREHGRCNDCFFVSIKDLMLQ